MPRTLALVAALTLAACTSESKPAPPAATKATSPAPEGAPAETTQACALSAEPQAALTKAAGAALRYLTPYSPDMNPIEKASSSAKRTEIRFAFLEERIGPFLLFLCREIGGCYLADQIIHIAIHDWHHVIVE